MHHVEILACKTCGHCRHATDVVTDQCVECQAEVHAVDLTRYPDAARKYGFQESPIVVVDGKVVAVGAIPHASMMRGLLEAPTPP